MRIRAARPAALASAAVLGVAACAAPPDVGDVVRPAAPARSEPLPWDSFAAPRAADPTEPEATRSAPDMTPPRGTATVSPPAGGQSPTPRDPAAQPETSDREPPPAADTPASAASEPEPVKPDDGTAPHADAERDVVELTNTERRKHGCHALEVDDRLVRAARRHSADMATHGFLDHTGSDGRSPADRADAAGYGRWGGENVAMGYPTPEDVMAGWLDSPGHRANIRNCDFRAIGGGVAATEDGRLYWTQKFGYE